MESGRGTSKTNYKYQRSSVEERGHQRRNHALYNTKYKSSLTNHNHKEPTQHREVDVEQTTNSSQDLGTGLDTKDLSREPIRRVMHHQPTPKF